MTATTDYGAPDPDGPARSDVPFPPRRASGLTRLAAFVESAGSHYARARGFDYGPERRDNVSLLSPYLRHRLVLEEELLAATLRRHSFAAADKFVQEIFWRAYFKGWMEQRPSVWEDYRSRVAELFEALERDGTLFDRFAQATAGETGIDCFDAWAKELVETGYLHNHARMWFASIWVYTLELPWQLGADFFYRHLIDGDPASNTLSWRWVCGLHTRGKTYLARVSNISSYTNNRFNPRGRLATSAPPLAESKVFPLRPLRASATLPRDSRYGLLITEEDAHPESLITAARPLAVIGATATRGRSPLPVGRRAAEFAAGAVRDALTRSECHFGADTEMIESDDWAEKLIDWVEARELDAVITAYAPVGPVAERLAEAAERLEAHGVPVLQIRREYDSTAWPLATRGYFKLKSRIPEILRGLNILDSQQREAL